jgi:hypothetical protein
MAKEPKCGTCGYRHAAGPRVPRRARAVRVEDELWEAAKRKADERGEVLSEVIREHLKRYVARR